CTTEKSASGLARLSTDEGLTPGNSLEHRCRFNLDQEPGICKGDDADPCRRRLGGTTERFSKGVTDSCRFFGAVVDDVDPQTDHVADAPTTRLDDSLEVPKRLSRLSRQVGAADELPVRIPRRLTRHIQRSRPAGRDCLGESAV